MIIITSVTIIVVGFLFYKLFTRSFNYFKVREIAYEQPKIEFRKIALPDAIKEVYAKHSNEKIFGVFAGTNPVFAIKCPELAKELCTKHFDHFSDHKLETVKNLDELLAKSLTSLKGEKWHNMRSILNSVFSENKMAKMIDLITKSVCDSLNAVGEKIKDGQKEDREMKEFCITLMVDVIATCAFGLEVNSIRNPKNDFKKFALQASNPNEYFVELRLGGRIAFPRMMRLRNVGSFPKNAKTYFKSTVVDAIQFREKTSVDRPDMINLLMEARKRISKENEDEKKTEIAPNDLKTQENFAKSEILTDEDLVAQCLLFLRSGFETSSSLLSYLTYELAVNPEIQKKLRQEIKATEQESGGMLTYDGLQKLSYLDQVTSETLRKWPSSIITDRVCSKSLNLHVDGKEIEIQEKRMFLIPIYGIHHDPKYFPEPDKFDPKRFSVENRRNITDTGAFMPFGIGPHNCLGSFFALMTIKTVIYYLLLHFELLICEKTQIPLKFSQVPMVVKSEKGIWVGLRKI